MSTYSPICTINGGSSVNGLNVTPGATVTIALASGPNSPAWSISCTSTDETTVAATITAGLSINQTTKVATLTAPADGKAMIFTSVVNGGLDPATQKVDSSLTTTLAVYTLTAAGNRVVAVNERGEGNSLFGWITTINPIIRATVTSPTVTAISPNVGFRLGGQAVTITGTGFLTGATVAIGGVSATGVTVNSSTNITCTTGTVGGEGLCNVVVTNPSAGSGTLPSGYLALAGYMRYRGLVGDYVLDNAGAGTHVGTLTDLTGNGRDLVSSGTNAGPTLAAASINGKQTLLYAPNQQLFKTSFAGPATAAEGFVVKKNGAGDGFLWTSGGSGSDIYLPQNGTGIMFDDFGSTTAKNGGVPPAITFTNAHLYNVRSSAGLWTMSLAGDQPFYATTTNVVGWPATFRLGCGAPQTSFYTGNVAEIVIMPRVLTALERGMVIAQLKLDWGV
jgi:hypothetical protein